ncbi:granulocyte-macrophage colony-stimulating factor receptor subunit alpha [Dromiciops gliroides]|uniref:granulocyte-macrophage colony-stimulating factor receptor subunit alpha n=1 Tax=Dromiciops gliroides TaxID=33562 RepID=UPI001CC765CF|nr:granulocyte-macrophage colony-stimulating factor receptor subunit alpha [Dromiciops gliroides]XP_043847371.1 granulocyte-macrophage colony-stimulating factor receptor subunit alpha [Dromiciops gliroides]
MAYSMADLVAFIWTWILLTSTCCLTQEQEGEDTAAENFSCIVYNVNFMNCTWTVGKAAPDDVQYYLYSENATYPGQICPIEDTCKECSNYIKDSQKRHVGCHFDKVQFNGKAVFIVNGTSKRIKIKQFCSKKISLILIERFTPPSNITVNCSKSNCLIQWQKPKTRIHVDDSEFQYQLDIQKQGSEYTNDKPFKIQGSANNEYNYSNYDKDIKHILKIRASRRNEKWGEWSEPIEFGGSAQGKGSPMYIYLLVIFGTLVFALVIIFVFKRYNVKQRLFPQIPQIKDKVNSCDHLAKEIIWEEFKHPEKCEEIMTIDVIG